jgi:FkbM family methyltransferase
MNGWLRNQSQSQAMQDYFALWVRKKSSTNASDAIFVEVGANDPKVGSNTYSLEVMGWNGLLIEPNPILSTKLEKNRRAKVKQVACSQIEGTLSIYIPEGASGLAHVINDSEVEMLGQGETIVVRAVRLTDLLEQLGFPQTIDYLSIDVEGHEVDVLNGLDLSRFQFQAVTIEHNYNDEAIAYFDNFFGVFDYRRVFSRLSAFDAWYVHPSLLGQLPT